MGFHDYLRLIHFHIGSQITKIRRIQTALREAAQFYISLHKMGYNVDFVDCGGGLGVDYDGTRSSSSEFRKLLYPGVCERLCLYIRRCSQ